MSKKKRITKAAQPESGELSVWYNGPDTMRLVPQSAPPQLVEIGGAPVTDTTHEFVLRKSRPDAEVENFHAAGDGKPILKGISLDGGVG